MQFQQGATVQFGASAATAVTFTSAVSLTATTPAEAAGAVDVKVTNPDAQYAKRTDGFTYYGTHPTVSSVTPSSGPTSGGTAVTISGVFANPECSVGLAVLFGSGTATDVLVTSPTTISATTPPGVGSVTVEVDCNMDSGALLSGFTYVAPLPPPTLSRLMPTSGPIAGGTAVTLSGANFQMGATVQFGLAAPEAATFINATSLSATTPAGTVGAVNVTVTNPDGQSASLPSGFTYYSVVSGITAGGYHTCAIVNGGAQCWGWNAHGQLGNGSTAGYSYVPVQVQGLTSGVTAIAAGWEYTCALVNGGVQCWGDDDYGELGNNSFTQSNVPVQVSNLTSGVSAIAAGFAHTCAVVNGAAWCWGDNSGGDLGNNSQNESNVPVQVSNLTSGVSAIAAGEDFSCAVVDGSAMCWGYNANGELGNNSTTESNVPVQVQGLSSGVQAIASGGGGADHTCAIPANNSSVLGGQQLWPAREQLHNEQ